MIQETSAGDLEEPGFELAGILQGAKSAVDFGKDLLEDVLAVVLVADVPRDVAAQAIAEFSKDPFGGRHAGFLARMKALANLPSTSGAIRSTSMPDGVSISRASRME